MNRIEKDVFVAQARQVGITGKVFPQLFELDVVAILPKIHPLNEHLGVEIFRSGRGVGFRIRILLPALAVATIVPLGFYARSRLLWVAIELRWWPLEAGEVEPPTD